MNTEQILLQILSMVKPYAHIGWKQSTFSNAIKAIKAGTYKPDKIERLFGLFGFVRNEVTWRKINITSDTSMTV